MIHSASRCFREKGAQKALTVHAEQDQLPAWCSRSVSVDVASKCNRHVRGSSGHTSSGVGRGVSRSGVGWGGGGVLTEEFVHDILNLMTKCPSLGERGGGGAEGEGGGVTLWWDAIDVLPKGCLAVFGAW